MFILKKGHQPGVYVPLRALFSSIHCCVNVSAAMLFGTRNQNSPTPMDMLLNVPLKIICTVLGLIVYLSPDSTRREVRTRTFDRLYCISEHELELIIAVILSGISTTCNGYSAYTAVASHL